MSYILKPMFLLLYNRVMCDTSVGSGGELAGVGNELDNVPGGLETSVGEVRRKGKMSPSDVE